MTARLGALLPWLLAGAAFFSGWAMRGAIADRDMAALQRDLAQQSEQVAAQAQQAQGRISDAVLRAGADALSGEQKALDDYSRLLRGADGWLPVPHGEDGHGVPPAPAPATPAGAKGQCRCPQQDRAKLQGLYQRQLTIARDCDITAARYNALLDIYHVAQQAMPQ